MDMVERLPPAATPLPETLEGFRDRIQAGRLYARTIKVAICGLARSLGPQAHRVIEQIENTGKMFASYGVVIFENDSVDNTKKILQDWAGMRDNVLIVSETLDRKHWPATRELGRMRDLAEYRNKCRREVLKLYGDYDYVLVVDTDLHGGWSLDGLADSLAQRDQWDMTGSVSWKLMDRGNWVHYDVWAFRNPGWEPLDARKVNYWLPRIGLPLVRLRSCFGGAGLYSMEAYKSSCYAGDDCEHVCLHRQMADQGFDRLFINPSQVTIY